MSDLHSQALAALRHAIDAADQGTEQHLYNASILLRVFRVGLEEHELEPLWGLMDFIMEKPMPEILADAYVHSGAGAMVLVALSGLRDILHTKPECRVLRAVALLSTWLFAVLGTRDYEPIARATGYIRAIALGHLPQDACHAQC